MEMDRSALELMESGQNQTPLLRFFQWSSPAVSYGYLLDPEKVKDYSQANGNFPLVKRPTGGGAVLHQTTDLSISLLWPRHQKIFPEKPKECYALIHQRINKALSECLGLKPTSNPHLFSPCAGDPTPGPSPYGEGNPIRMGKRFSVCFSEPVCNDVMLGGEKIVGGALRLTRKAILYQGNIQWKGEKGSAFAADAFRHSLRLFFLF